MHIATTGESDGLVALTPKELGKRRDIGTQLMPRICCPMPIRVETGQKRCMSGQGPRRGREGVAEARRLTSEPVLMGELWCSRAKGAERGWVERINR